MMPRWPLRRIQGTTLDKDCANNPDSGSAMRMDPATRGVKSLWDPAGPVRYDEGMESPQRSAAVARELAPGSKKFVEEQEVRFTVVTCGRIMTNSSASAESLAHQHFGLQEEDMYRALEERSPSPDLPPPPRLPGWQAGSVTSLCGSGDFDVFKHDDMRPEPRSSELGRNMEVSRLPDACAVLGFETPTSCRGEQVCANEFVSVCWRETSVSA